MQKTIDPSKYDTDKSRYAKTYNDIFGGLADKNIKLLELGILRGGSLRLWRDYFTNGLIVGLDYNPIQITDSERIRIYQGSQDDLTLLEKVGKEMAPDGFDIIIDDASHIAELTSKSFWFLFNNYMKPGGIYVIEDWGTGYWPSWPDGKFYEQNKKRLDIRRSFWKIIGLFVKSEPKNTSKNKLFEGINARLRYRVGKYTFQQEFSSHNSGMVGFIKQLVDECATEDITTEIRGLPPCRRSSIQKIEIHCGQAVVYKALNQKEIKNLGR